MYNSGPLTSRSGVKEGSVVKGLPIGRMIVGENVDGWEYESCEIWEVFLSSLTSEVPGELAAGAVHETVGVLIEY